MPLSRKKTREVYDDSTLNNFAFVVKDINDNILTIKRISGSRCDYEPEGDFKVLLQDETSIKRFHDNIELIKDDSYFIKKSTCVVIIDGFLKLRYFSNGKSFII